MGKRTQRLDRRRDKLRAARADLDRAARGAADVEAELHAHVSHTQALEVELAAARKRTEVLENSLRAAGPTKERLRDERTEARRRVREARRGAERAERRYDRVVLDDMIRRAKARDLARHPAAPGSGPAGDDPPEPRPPVSPTAGSTTRQPDAAQLARRTGRPVATN